ncbi:MAG: guanine deaminase [Pseudomonadota bacterium]
MTAPLLLQGRVLRFAHDPFEGPAEAALRLDDGGGVLVEAGRIAEIGDAAALAEARPGARRVDLGRRILAPAFVDCHNHFAQTRMIASWGARLIDWLNRYTFPEEARFDDPAYAAAVAEDYLDLMIANGTGTAAAYCTTHAASVDALFAAAEARGVRLAAGKVMMDRNGPAALLDDAKTGYDQSRELIERWHGRGRLSYAVTPRFAPTSTPQQLEAAGALWAEHPDCLMQTHLSEQVEEVAWVRELFPSDRDYLAVYERFGLCGPGAIMGHGVHLSDRERAALAERGAAVAHCPTSNAFIGSGLCDVAGLRAAGVGVGLATDVGGGSSFSMLATMRSAYEIGQLRGGALHPAQLWWLATEGAASAMRATAHVGALEPGREADIIALDPEATPVLAQRAARAEDASDLLFALLMLGDDRAVAETWIAGAPQKGAFP